LMTANSYGLHNHFIKGFISDATKTSHGLYITGTGSAAYILIGGNSWFASACQQTGGSSTCNGIRIDVASIGQMRIEDSHIYNNKGAGIYITSNSTNPNAPVPIIGNTFNANGSGANSGNNSAIYINVATTGAFGPLIDGNSDYGSNGVSLLTSSTSNNIYVGANQWASGHTYGTTPVKDLGW